MLGLVHPVVIDGDVTWERSVPTVPSLGLVHHVLSSARPGRAEVRTQCVDAVTVSPHADIVSTPEVQPWTPSSKSKKCVFVGAFVVEGFWDMLGKFDGELDGCLDGSMLGNKDGEPEGLFVFDGSILGKDDGELDGSMLGTVVGRLMG